MLSRAGILATLVVLGVATGGCARAFLSDEVDASPAEVDAAEIDARLDAAEIDAAEIDAAMIDARMIDARMIDAAMIDARIIDAAMIDARVCAHMPCDILTQCGCEATPTTPVCDLDLNMVTTGGTTCRAGASGGESTACTNSTMCAAGFVCASGRCRRYCDDDNDCPGAGGVCAIELTQGSPATPIPNLPTTCTTDCIPSLANNATCPSGWACHAYLYDPDEPPVTDGDERFISDCDPAPATSGGWAGSVCTSNRNCQPGLDCVNLNPGGLQCRPTCLCNGTNCTTGTCPNGAGTCHGYTTPLTIGTQTYGVCF